MKFSGCRYPNLFPILSPPPPFHPCKIDTSKARPISSLSTASTNRKWNSNTTFLITHPSLLLTESCNSMSHLKQIQAHLTRIGLIFHTFPASRVLAFCAIADCGDIHHADRLFSQIQQPNTFMWNTMIRGYSIAKFPLKSFGIFREMVRAYTSIVMDERSFVFALKTCEQFTGISTGESVHCVIIKRGFFNHLIIQNGLIHLYSEIGTLYLAYQVFDESFARDVVSWTTIIDCFVKRNMQAEAVKLFNMTREEEVEPNDVTIISVLSLCSQNGNRNLGSAIHGYMEKMKIRSSNPSLNLMNALMDMYTKCASMCEATEVFESMYERDVFSWTIMVDGFSKNRELHKARKLFDKMPQRNVISWNAMISGYSQNNQPREAIDLFNQMASTSGIVPTESTLSSVLSSCSQSGSLDFGRWVHHYILNARTRTPYGSIIGNALIDMYSKCGSIDMADEVFRSMITRDLVSWNSMIVGYAAHGKTKKALALFEEMKSLGIQPDDITFVGVLSACTHGGLVVEGWRYFKSIKETFGIEPKREHYACVVDMVGRVGYVEEAYKLIQYMPMEPDEATWGALLNACCVNGNVELGKFAAIGLHRLDPTKSGLYVQFATLCAKQRRWDDVRMIRKKIREGRVKKTPGCSLIQVDCQFFEFVSADESHPSFRDIYRIVNELLFFSQVENQREMVLCD